MATIFSPIADITPDEFRRTTEVTYLGYVWGTMAALKRMRPRSRAPAVRHLVQRLTKDRRHELSWWKIYVTCKRRSHTPDGPFSCACPGLVPGTHVVGCWRKDVDGRDRPGREAV
jgi:NAD(P)-dependent dehydrogenase (short-subunit alcohol dehydrogenase family)